jgi:hypothetical protein
MYEEKMLAQANVPHLKIDLCGPSTLSFDFKPPQINFFKTAGLKNLSKRNLHPIDGTTVTKIKSILF